MDVDYHDIIRRFGDAYNAAHAGALDRAVSEIVGLLSSDPHLPERLASVDNRPAERAIYSQLIALAWLEAGEFERAKWLHAAGLDLGKTAFDDLVHRKIGASSDSMLYWNRGSIVDAHDDYADLQKHRHLPYNEFVEKTGYGRYRRPFVEWLMKNTFAGNRVLEAGCAAGGYYGVLSTFDPNLAASGAYFAFDISRDMLDRSRTHYPQLPASRMNVCEIGYADRMFDFAFSTDVLMHVPEWFRGLQELWRVTNRALAIRIRAYLKDDLETRVFQLGCEADRHAYVIHNLESFTESIRKELPEVSEVEFLGEDYFAANDLLRCLVMLEPELPRRFNHEDELILLKSVDLVIRRK